MGIATDDMKRYFDDARRFDQDRALASARSQRVAWVVAGIATATAACCGLALAVLVPLKTTEPYVIRVDNATGIVDVVNALSADKTTYDEAVTKFFAARYVRSREGYALAEAEENFRHVSLLSASDEQARFAAAYRGSNPESPQVVYGRTATSKIAISSISLITKSIASVRYLRTVTRGEEARTTHWVATVTFQYVNLSLTATDRLINPLGFVVNEYHADPEAVQ
jgi:type IV secretion system protein VirB8